MTDLQKLQKLWYKKLKEEGFKDIEDPEGPRNGGRNASYSFEYINMDQYQAVQDYYSMARQFSHEYAFNEVHNRIIWEYYAEGISVRKISTLLKTEHNIKLAKSAIWRRIKNLEKIKIFKSLLK